MESQIGLHERVERVCLVLDAAYWGSNFTRPVLCGLYGIIPPKYRVKDSISVITSAFCSHMDVNSVVVVVNLHSQ